MEEDVCHVAARVGTLQSRLIVFRGLGAGGRDSAVPSRGEGVRMGDMAYHISSAFDTMAGRRWTRWLCEGSAFASHRQSEKRRCMRRESSTMEHMPVMKTLPHAFHRLDHARVTFRFPFRCECCLDEHVIWPD